MLPDLRIVIAAVISTFVLTVGVGFYASSRLIQEPKKRTDSLAAHDETPVNRIALSWPEPTRQPDQPALDFAVTAKALRNPVRDVTHDAHKPVRESAAKPPSAERITDIARPAPQLDTSVKVEERASVTPPLTIAPPAAPPIVANAKPAPEPEADIRIAVQYPPIIELPPELRAPVIAPIAAAPSEPQQESRITTGSVVEVPSASETALPDRAKPESRVASRPEPDSLTTEKEKAEASPATKPTLKPATKPAPKKAAKKVAPKAKRPARAVRRQTVAPANTFPFNFFGSNLSN